MKETPSPPQLNQDEVREKLQHLSHFLRDHSLFPGDLQEWASSALTRYLNGLNDARTLDHAFGLKRSKRGRKAGELDAGKHVDWAPDAWREVISATPEGKNWPDTRTLAKIARNYPLRRDIATTDEADDHALAADLKRILNRYKPQIIAHWSRVILDGLNGKDQAD